MNASNTDVTFKGNPANLEGAAVVVGQKLPEFTLTGNGMAPVTNQDIEGKVVILSLVPSLDTAVCSLETKRFNTEANEFGDKAVILTASADLPFAQARWCAAEGATNLITASSYRNTQEFGKSFGAYLPSLGLLARTVIVADKNGVVQSVEYVKEVTTEPDYQAAINKVRELL